MTTMTQLLAKKFFTRFCSSRIFSLFEHLIKCQCCLACTERLLESKSDNINFILIFPCHVVVGCSVGRTSGCSRLSDVVVEAVRTSCLKYKCLLPGEHSLVALIALWVNVLVTLRFLRGAAGIWVSIAKPYICTEQVN